MEALPALRETIAAAKRNTRTFVPWVGAEDTHDATRMRRGSQVPLRRTHGGRPKAYAVQDEILALFMPSGETRGCI
jgi:hypothetical protein